MKPDHEISKAAQWQRKKASLGLCVQCGKRPLFTKQRCLHCSEKNRPENRQRMRDRYRLNHGIPLDAPIIKRGRPRTETPIDWQSVDWTLSNAEISRILGVTPPAVRQGRKRKTLPVNADAE